MASPEEGLMPFRSDPGLGGASWAAMIRPSCYNDGRPSSPCSTRETCKTANPSFESPIQYVLGLTCKTPDAYHGEPIGLLE